MRYRICGRDHCFIHFTLPGVLASVAIVLFVALASWRVSLPGLQYDEVLFVQAALGSPHGLFVHQSVGGIPVMTMTYLGALKSWLYAPIFYLFGVSPVTIRLPMILLSALTLVLLYRFLRRDAGALAACLAVWLAALDTAFIFHSRLDWGPFVVATFLKVAVLGCVFGYIRRPSWASAVGGGILGILGLWDKLNFVWFLTGLFVAFIVCYPRVWLSLGGRVRPASRWWLLAGGLAVALILTALGYRYWNLSASALSIARVQQVGVNTLYTFSGTLLTSFLLNHPLGFPTFNPSLTAVDILKANPLGFSAWPWDFLLALVPVALVLVRFSRRNAVDPMPDLRRAVFVIVLSVIMFLMIVVTPDSGHMHQSHHMMILHPFHIILVALAFQALLSVRHSRVGIAALSVFCGVAGWVMVAGAVNTVDTLRYLGRDERVDVRWSPRIYELVRLLNESAADTDWVISVDWGIHNQLLALGSPALRERLDDEWLELKYLRRYPDDERRLVARLRSGRRTLAIAYAKGEAVQKHARAAFFELLNRESIPYRLLTRVGRPEFTVYEVYEILGTGSQDNRHADPGSGLP